MKLPLNLIQSEAERLESQRECGPCTACCVLPRIPIGEEDVFPQGKRGYTPCKHLRVSLNLVTGACGGGCDIYEHRPGLCRDYKCLWRAGLILGDERRRPDKLGLMFTFDIHDEERGIYVVEAWELWDGAAREHPGRGVIEAIAQYAHIRIRFYGVPAALSCECLPHTLDLGRALSGDSKHNPRALAAWLDREMSLGHLNANNLQSVQNDMEPLRRGEPVERHYNRP